MLGLEHCREPRFDPPPMQRYELVEFIRICRNGVKSLSRRSRLVTVCFPLHQSTSPIRASAPQVGISTEPRMIRRSVVPSAIDNQPWPCLFRPPRLAVSKSGRSVNSFNLVTSRRHKRGCLPPILRYSVNRSLRHPQVTTFFHAAGAMMHHDQTATHKYCVIRTEMRVPLIRQST